MLTIDETEVRVRPHTAVVPLVVQQGPGSLTRSGLERREPHMRTLHDSPPPPNDPDRRSDRTQLAYYRRAFRGKTLRCMVMEPFVFQHAQDVWPAGETLLHVYLTPHDQDRELAALVARGRAILREFPITCVEDRWLHITVVINRSSEKTQVKHAT
ncbi:hypothetical protein GCM10010207_84270 [Streptomyces atratus]|nr:hypothetical protein GCM10010207_84270 [Streptomyces atratus]